MTAGYWPMELPAPPKQIVKAIARFVLAHGGFATGVLEYVGRRRVRIVLIGEDGVWGDQVVPNMAMARAVCLATKIDVVPEWSQAIASTMGLSYI